MMTDDLLIKSARPEDADRAAVLLYSAYTHRPLPEDGENWFVERLEHCFREAGNRFSYQNNQVAEQYGEVVGLVLNSYPKVALTVTRENKQALSLYERLQYTAECQEIELSCS